MATALTSELTRFTDKCNNVLAGGIVKTFEPNSLTPKTTYQDPECTIPNFPEITLDETGRAKIYISGDYRIQVYSRDGVLIEDNLLVEQTLVQRDFVELSQEIQTELQQALDQFQIESTAAVDNLYAAITSIGGMVVDGQFKLDWAHVFNRPTTVVGYGITDAYTKTEANTTFIENSEKAVASGVATLDANTKVPAAQLPLNNTLASASTTEAATAAMTKKLNDEKLAITAAFGIGQTYQNVTASRAMDTTYTNSDAKARLVIVQGSTLNGSITATVDGETLPAMNMGNNLAVNICTWFIVLPTKSYSVNGVSLARWVEMKL